MTFEERAAEVDRISRRNATLPPRPSSCGKPGCTIDHARWREELQRRAASRPPVVRDAAFEQRKARRMAMTGGTERLIASRDPRMTFPDYDRK